LPTNQLRQKLGHPLKFPLRPAIFDRHVLTVGKADFIQPTLKRSDLSADWIKRFAMKKSNHWHCRLLCAGSGRPCRRSAYKHDELASPHIRYQVPRGCIVPAQTNALIEAETGIKTIAAVRC
jgi:hypothetical protein